MLVRSKARTSTTVDGVRISSEILGGAIYKVVEQSQEYYKLQFLSGREGWYLKDGFEEVRK